MAELLTVGHSTHEPWAFIELLRGAGVQALADVRRYPGSRRMPWFNEDALHATLADAGIGYVHLPELGGRRQPLPGSPNGGWRVGQLQGYADHMETPEFEAGLSRLLELAAQRRTAAMARRPSGGAATAACSPTAWSRAATASPTSTRVVVLSRTA